MHKEIKKITRRRNHTQTQSHADAITRRRNHTQTQSHAGTITRRRNHTQTQSQADAITSRRRRNRTQMQTQTRRRNHTQTQTQSHADASTRRRTRTLELQFDNAHAMNHIHTNGLDTHNVHLNFIPDQPLVTAVSFCGIPLGMKADASTDADAEAGALFNT